jgi:hypothetical protein
MRSGIHKSERLAQLERLLRLHPQGLRRADLARRLGLHRSTVGRYIDELSRKVPIWEDDYLIRIKLDDGDGSPLDMGDAAVLYLVFKSVLAGMTSFQGSLVRLGTMVSAQLDSAHPTLGQAMRMEVNRYTARFPMGVPVASSGAFEIFVEAWCRSLPLRVHFAHTSPFRGQHAGVLVSALRLDDRDGAIAEVRVEAQCLSTGRSCTFRVDEVEDVSFVSGADGAQDCGELCVFTRNENDAVRIHHRFRRLLIVDDEPSALGYLELLLGESYARIATAATVAEALVYLRENAVDLVICDLFLTENPASRWLKP